MVALPALALGMRLAPWIALASLSALPARATEPAVRGLEPVERRLERKLPHPKRGIPAERATRTCLAYAGHAVLWADEGEMGGSDLVIRRRPKGMSAEEACAERFHGKAVRPAEGDDAMSPAGVFDRWLLEVSADVFGELASFALFDLDTGARAYQDDFAFGRGLRLERTAKGPVLTYWASLGRFDCIPRRGEAGCWSRIRERHAIPAEVPQPDCEDAIAASPGMLEAEADRTAQITVHVRVPRLARREAAFLPDPPSCSATP
jgi:hypothetical protein